MGTPLIARRSSTVNALSLDGHIRTRCVAGQIRVRRLPLALQPGGKMSVHELPVLVFDNEPVYHCGTLDPSAASAARLEGSALAVSTCPQSWRRIARIPGGHPTYALTRPGARFIDLFALDQRTRAKMLRVCCIEGLLQRQMIYRVTWIDDDLEAEMVSLCPTSDEAIERAGDDPDLITQLPGHAPSRSLERRHGQLDLTIAADVALLTLAASLGFDGLWWAEALDPLSYSAPRGAIYPAGEDALARWRVEAVTGPAGDDDTASERPQDDGLTQTVPAGARPGVIRASLPG